MKQRKYCYNIDEGDNVKILYKQLKEDRNSSLYSFGIGECYFKRLSFDHDRGSITKKTHHHIGFEIHIVTQGYQEYEVCGTKYKLEKGKFLLIFPNTSHTVVDSAPKTQKFSITFNKQIDEPLNCFFGTLGKRIFDNIDFVLDEAQVKKENSQILIENAILEIIILVFRLSGMKEKEVVYKQNENAIISLAKQYIKDNVNLSPSVADVAQYCYLSTKHLTRIFHRFEGISPGDYIIKCRIARIEKMLADHTFSLKQISERMNFHNEYYFNTFFKKYSGMPPGEYRKMLGQ